MQSIKVYTECCVFKCEQPATIFTKGLRLCPRHYLEIDKEHKTLMFKAEAQEEISAR